MMTADTERRRYTRIPFDVTCCLINGDDRVVVELLDISLNGALISKPAVMPNDEDKPYYLDIELNDNAGISMEVKLAHVEDHTIGFQCVRLDMDSASHLRRLIELNIGIENASERVLEELLSGHKA
jgi:hypothetical protein